MTAMQAEQIVVQFTKIADALQRLAVAAEQINKYGITTDVR